MVTFSLMIIIGIFGLALLLFINEVYDNHWRVLCLKTTTEELLQFAKKKSSNWLKPTQEIPAKDVKYNCEIVYKEVPYLDKPIIWIGKQVKDCYMLSRHVNQAHQHKIPVKLILPLFILNPFRIFQGTVYLGIVKQS